MSNCEVLQQFKDMLIEKQKPLDTLGLQLQSVERFMGELGYSLHQPQKQHKSPLKGYIRTKIVQGVKLPKCISFQDACRLHNGVCMRVVGNSWCDLLSMRGSFTMESYLKAIHAKLVGRVYLQRDGRWVKVQQHWVKLDNDN